MERSEFENELNSAMGGVFTVDSFFTRFGREFDLKPEDGDVQKSALPIHVHEFVHFMHNTSTTAGLRMANFKHALIINFVQSFVGPGGLIAGGVDEFTKYIVENIKFVMGGFESGNNFFPKHLGLSWSFDSLKSFSAPIEDQSELGYSINIKGSRGENIVLEEVLLLGWSFITEGVAFEIERITWMNADFDTRRLEEMTGAFPYYAYGALVNHLVGRETSTTERVRVGNVALLHISPGHGLIEACKSLAKGDDEFHRYAMFCQLNYVKYLRGTFLEFLNLIKDFYAHSEFLGPIAKNYSDVLLRAASHRENYVSMEEMFLQSTFDVDKFYRATSFIAPHIVIQEKYGAIGTVEMIDLTGGLMAGKSEEIMVAYSAFCSMIHYISQHIKRNGDISGTSELRPVKCPFSNACEIQHAEKYPESCNKAPWKLERVITAAQGGVCWYQAGVQSLQSKKSTSRAGGAQ